MVTLYREEDLLSPVIRMKDDTLSEAELLKHYAQEGATTLQGLDNMGNFLMGFGMVVLGYLLNIGLKFHITNAFYGEKYILWSRLALSSWGISVALLMIFAYLYVFHLLAGRTIHCRQNDKKSLGQRIKIRKMSYEQFEKLAPTFDDFLANNYLQEDRRSTQQLWYATFRYTRYMAFKKLMIMNQMRSVLAWAMISGVTFKIIDMILQG